MSYQEARRSPEGCRNPRCVHLIEYKTSDGPNDCCAKKIPMHSPCSWKETAEDLRVKAEREGSL